MAGISALALAASGVLATSSTAEAQTWTGGAGTMNWFDAANWSPGIVPPGAAVVINNGSTASPVVIDAAGAQSGGLKLGSTAGSVGGLLVTGAGRITDTGTYFIVGDHGEGAVTVSNGGQVTTKHTVVANFPGTVGFPATTGNVLVTGPGSQWTATELTVSYDTNVGTFVVADGGKLQIVNPGGNAIVTLGRDSTAADGTLTVTGAGSSFVITNGVNFNIGSPGRGVFNLLDGATADTSAIVSINNKSKALVSGTGSIWTAQGGITNQGPLTVTDGGTLASNGRVTVGDLGTATIADGGTLTATQFEVWGTATIGSGGTVVSSGRVWVGNGSGVLTVTGGGMLRLTDPAQGLLIGSGIGTGGTLIIGAGAGQPAVAPGTVEAPYVVFEGSANPGPRTLVFNHTSNNYVFAPYITGGAGKGDVKVLAGTTTLSGGVALFNGTIDISNGATLKITANASPNLVLPVDTKNDGTLFLNSTDFFTKATGNISGAGNVVKTGSGWLTLTGQNSWTGGTEVQGGRLYVGELVGAEPQDGTLVGDVLNNGEMIFRRKTDYTFGGAISGSGTFEKEGAGTLTLTGQSTYAGTTTVWSGGLALGADDRLPTATTLRLFGGTFDLNGHSQTVGNLAGFAGGTLAIGNGALTTVTSVNTTLPSDITGTGDFIKQGAAALTLTGTKGFAGTTTVAGGRLQVDGSMAASRIEVNSGTVLAGSGTVGDTSVANGGALEGRTGQTLTMNALALSASSIINVTLGAPGSLTGLFKVNGNLVLDGTLNVSDADGFGAGVYRVIDYAGSLTDNGLDVGMLPSGTATVQTAVANQINLLVDGSSGPIPATQFWNGTTTVADDTIHGGSGIWSAGPVTNWTDVNGAAAYTWGGQFAVFQNNPGVVAVDNSTGSITTTGMQFVGQGWTIAGDPIALNGAGGQTTLRVGDGLAASADDSATIASELTGNSRLVKDDYGTLIITGTNSYASGTTIAAGSLQIGNGAATGSIVGDVLNNATLAFNRSDATTFGGTMTGSGAVRLMSGDLTLTANNSYSGGTDIVAGSTLRLGNGGAIGTINGNVANDGTLIFNRSNDLTFAGILSGSGSIRQIGTGKTELTGNSGGFAGVATVENGILAVNGTLGGTLDVLTGGRLQGIGMVGDTFVSGAIAPGNSIGTLNVAGDITFNAGSIYEVEVNAAGQSDKIIASGEATIAGGTVQVQAGMGSYAPATIYTILTANLAAGGVTGTFSDVISNLAFLDPALSYDATNVYLTMTRNETAFQNVGITPNQIAAGGGVESLDPGNPIYDAVVNLSADQARYAFDQLSGEIHASVLSVLIDDSRFIRNAVNDRIRAAFDVAGTSGGTVVSYENGAPGAVWGQAFGSWGRRDGDGNAASLNRSTGGFFIGADAPVFDTWRVGAVAGYGHTGFDVPGRLSSGASDSYHVGLYGGTQWGDLAFRTGAAYTWNDISTSRDVTFPGFDDSLKGDYTAATAQLFGELAYGFRAGAARFEPYANLAYVTLRTNGFIEQGGAASLTGQSANADAAFTTLGLRASTTFDLNGSTLTAKGMVGWRHAFGDVAPPSTMRFASGGDAFNIAGVPMARDAVVIEAGFDFALAPNATLGVSYGGQFGSGLSDQFVRANFNVKF